MISMYDWIDGWHGKWFVRDKIDWENLGQAFDRIAANSTSLVAVHINNNPMFHGATGQLGTHALTVAELCRAKGFLVSEDQNLWRSLSSQCESNCSYKGNSLEDNFYKFGPPAGGRRRGREEGERSYPSQEVKLGLKEEDELFWYKESTLSQHMFCDYTARERLALIVLCSHQSRAAVAPPTSRKSTTAMTSLGLGGWRS